MRAIICIPLLFSFALFGQTESENSAPKSSFVLEINGVEYYLSDGETLQLDSTYTKPTVTVRMSEYRRFDNEAISFDYPNHFAYQYEQDFGYRNWTLDGNNFVIMYFQIDGEAGLDLFVDEMVKQFGKQNCKLRSTTMTLGDQILEGKHIDISLIGQRLTLDFMEIKLNDFKSHFIAFQDTMDEYGQPTEESKASLELIDGTIRYKDE